MARGILSMNSSNCLIRQGFQYFKKEWTFSSVLSDKYRDT